MINALGCYQKAKQILSLFYNLRPGGAEISLPEGIYGMKEMGLSGQYRSAGCAPLSKVYMAFTPDQAQIGDVNKMRAYFDVKMAELKKSGQIEGIMNQYGLEDWKNHMK